MSPLDDKARINFHSVATMLSTAREIDEKYGSGPLSHYLEAVKRAYEKGQFTGTSGVVKYGSHSIPVGKGIPIPSWVYNLPAEGSSGSSANNPPAARGGRADFERELQKTVRSTPGMTEVHVTYPDGTRKSFSN